MVRRIERVHNSPGKVTQVKAILDPHPVLRFLDRNRKVPTTSV